MSGSDLSQLSSDEVQAASSAVCTCVTDALALNQELQYLFAAPQFEIQAQMEADPVKFNIAKLACDGIEDFDPGLTGRIGMPHVKFEEAMKQEHCDRAGCNVSFTTGNCKIATTPKQDWLYIAGDEVAQHVACPVMRIPAPVVNKRDGSRIIERTTMAASCSSNHIP